MRGTAFTLQLSAFDHACVLYVFLRKTFFVRRKKGSFEHWNLRTKIVFEVFYRSTAHRLQQSKPAPLASGGSFSYQVVELRRL